jgi:Fe-S-cluster containining protein
MNKFKCVGCGNCCRNFGSVGDDYPKFAENNVLLYSKPRLVFYDWEKKQFPKNSVIPHEIFYEINKKVSIIISYTIKEESCPNLMQDNKCRVYKKRPVICRTFPSAYANIKELKYTKRLANNSRICNVELEPEKLHKKLGFRKDLINNYKINNDDLIKNSYKRYGDVFVYKFMKYNNDKIINKFLVDLQIKKNFRFAGQKTHDLNTIIKLVESSKKIDFSKLFKHYTNYDLKNNFSEESFKRIKKIILNNNLS